MKTTNLLKITFSLLIVSFLFYRCQDDDSINYESSLIEQIKLKSNFDIIDQPHIKNNITVDWNNYIIIEQNNIRFYQFNTEFINPLKNSSERLGSPSIFLLVYELDKKVFLKYIQLRAYDFAFKKKPSNLFDLDLFSGNISYYNEKGDRENTESFIEGYLVKSEKPDYLQLGRTTLKQAQEKGNLNFKRVEPCTLVPSVLHIHETTHHYTDYYNRCDNCTNADGNIITHSDGHTYIFVKSVYEGVSTETHTYTSYSCDTPHTGDEVYKSEYMRQQALIDCGPAYNNVDANGDCFLDENQIVVDDPSTPISDINQFLKCFDVSLGAQITIYIDQPIANNSSSFTTGQDKAGHSFIAITQGNITRVFGLYPNGNASPFSPNHPHIFGNNQNDSFDISLSFSIPAASLANIINDAEQYNMNYNLNTNNCTDFVIQAAALCGVSLPDPQGSWPGGSGSNPRAFGEAIRQMNLSSGMTRNTNGGQAISNNGNCN